MTDNASNAGPNDTREFDLVVFGATGLTGRLVVEQLAANDGSLGRASGKRRWAVSGRDRAKVAGVLKDLSLDEVEIIVADLEDTPSLEALAARTTVVLSLAGPYTKTAETLIGACVAAGTSYVDLSGEIPLLRRVVDRFDDAAKRAGVQVVQMAGWEAMPADLATLVACRRAAPEHTGDDGPGAADPITAVTVSIKFTRVPEGGVPFKQSVSAGTMASVIAMLDDPDARFVGRTEALLPEGSRGPKALRPAPLRLGAKEVDGRVLGPVVPVAFLNPPIVNRTAALLAEERGEAYQPADYREGVDAGWSGGTGGLRRTARATMKGVGQRLAVGMTRLPLTVRRAIASGIRKILPEAGTGPSGSYLHDWNWTVQAHATGRNGAVGTATIEGSGHPGYTATAAIIVEVALRMAARRSGTSRAGCITPALAIGASDEELKVSSLRLR
ncbi:saccharopine dehydrogenase NADP-binding domain-containing protein [Sphingomonas bacterium]|uniref:saccharopine dehydrogenase NADP-binding domain-containing protein n=1 Tax=Sphingomonas bacterium TaxID=1895847 RepID=UPI001575AE6B|nr:saccharopine dehydrogenase NADP-binding domain-containing protein [Sphingomonas bacterium]